MRGFACLLALALAIATAFQARDATAADDDNAVRILDGLCTEMRGKSRAQIDAGTIKKYVERLSKLAETFDKRSALLADVRLDPHTTLEISANAKDLVWFAELGAGSDGKLAVWVGRDDKVGATLPFDEGDVSSFVTTAITVTNPDDILHVMKPAAFPATKLVIGAMGKIRTQFAGKPIAEDAVTPALAAALPIPQAGAMTNVRALEAGVGAQYVVRIAANVLGTVSYVSKERIRQGETFGHGTHFDEVTVEIGLEGTALGYEGKIKIALVYSTDPDAKQNKLPDLRTDIFNWAAVPLAPIIYRDRLGDGLKALEQYFATKRDEHQRRADEIERSDKELEAYTSTYTQHRRTIYFYGVDQTSFAVYAAPRKRFEIFVDEVEREEDTGVSQTTGRQARRYSRDDSGRDSSFNSQNSKALDQLNTIHLTGSWGGN